MKILDATNYRDKPTRTGGTLYDRVDVGLLPGFERVVYEDRVWWNLADIGDWDSFDPALFLAWAAAQESGVVRIIDCEGLFQRIDTRYHADGASYAQAHAFWGALRDARAANPGEKWAIYGCVYGLAYPWVNHGPTFERAVRKVWGPLDRTLPEVVQSGEIAEAAMSYPAADILLTAIGGLGVRPIDLMDYVLVSAYVAYPPADVAAAPTAPAAIVRANMQAAARFGKPLMGFLWDRHSSGSAPRVTATVLQEVFLAAMERAGDDGAVAMWSHSPGHPTAPQSFAADHAYWRPLWDAAYDAWRQAGTQSERVPWVVPAPIKATMGDALVRQKIGQPPLQCAMTIGDLVGGDRTVTIRVLNLARERCSGLYGLRVVIGTEPDGGPDGEQTLQVVKGVHVHEPDAGRVLDVLTYKDGESQILVTALEPGTRWVRVLSITQVESEDAEWDGADAATLGYEPSSAYPLTDGDKGDITVSSAGTVWTIDAGAVVTSMIADDAVTLAKMAEMATDRLLGRDTAGTGNPEALTVGGGVEFTGSGGIQRSALTGDVTASAGSNATTIANNAVSFAKMQAVSANVLLGNDASGTAVEEIACTAAGRALIADADASAQRTTLGLGSIATQASSSVSITGGSITGITDLAVADGGTGASNAADARTNLGLVIGTDVQAYDAELAAIAGLTSAADKGVMFTGSGTAAVFTLTAAALTVLDDATVAAMVDTLGGASSTGTGGLARATSPAFTTPDIGTPSAGTLTNCSGLPLTGVSISGGTEDTAPAMLSDYAAVYDASASANRKVLLANINAAFNLKRMFLVWDDFMSTAAPMGLGGSTSGTGAGISNSGTFAAANVVGVAALSTGTTTTGRSALTGFTLSVVFGTNVWHFEAYVGTDPVGDATNDYTIRCGFIDSASAESTDGHYIRQNYNVNGGRFEAVTRSNTTETATDTTVAFAAFTLFKFEIDVSADGSSAVFKINGSTVATHSTGGGATMPTGTSRAAGYGFYIQKAAGTTARNLYVDYYMVYSPVVRS